MLWQLLIFLSIILYAVSTVLQRFLLKNDKTEPISFSIFFQIGVALVIGIIVILIEGSFPLPDFAQIIWSVLLMTVLYTLATIFVFRSLKITEASKFTVIISSKTLFAVFGASLILNEGLTIIQWLGAVLIILGIIIISIKNIGKKINIGDVFALLAAIVIGFANINDRFLVKFFNPYSYVAIGFLLPGLLTALIHPKKLAYLKTYLHKSFIYKMLLLCLLNGLCAVAFYASLQLTPNSSQLFAINSFGAIITVILSIFILKEKDDVIKKIVGVLVSFFGLLLVNT